MVFAAVRRRPLRAAGPDGGAAITILLTETLHISFGTAAIGWGNIVYGALLVSLIIFLPQGLLGSLLPASPQRRPARHSALPTRS
jgi:ABC-type branched-subunit amino acid transport system permease subunit